MVVIPLFFTQLLVSASQLFAGKLFSDSLTEVNSGILLSSVVSRLTNASSECLSRERGVFYSYWAIPLHPNSSLAAPSSQTASKRSTASLKSSIKRRRSSTTWVQTGSRLRQLSLLRASGPTANQPGTWQEGAEVHLSTRRCLIPGRQLQAHLPRDP